MLKYILILLFSISLLSSERPNIIIIITDDFHINRIQMLLSGIDKNLVFAPIKNYNDFDTHIRHLMQPNNNLFLPYRFKNA